MPEAGRTVSISIYIVWGDRVMPLHIFWYSWPPQWTNIRPTSVSRHPKNERGKICIGSIAATDYARTWLDYTCIFVYILLGDWLILSQLFLIQLATPIDQYLTQIGPRHHKNERVKICVGSITATDYATRTLSDCIHFCLYIMGRPSDALAACLIQSATPMGQYLTQTGHRHEYLSKLQRQSLHHHLIMPETGQTTSIFVYILWGD